MLETDLGLSVSIDDSQSDKWPFLFYGAASYNSSIMRMLQVASDIPVGGRKPGIGMMGGTPQRVGWRTLPEIAGIVVTVNSQKVSSKCLAAKLLILQVPFLPILEFLVG